MKLKLNDLLLAQSAISRLNQTNGFRAVIAYRISKNIKPIKKEVDLYEEQRKKLLDEYSEKDEEGKPIIEDNQYDITDENLKIVNDELEKLRDEDVEITVKKVTLDDIERAELSPAQLESIEFMLDLKEEK